MILASALIAWAAVLVLVVGACAAARIGDAASIDAREPQPALPESAGRPQLAAAEPSRVELEHAA